MIMVNGYFTCVLSVVTVAELYLQSVATIGLVRLLDEGQACVRVEGLCLVMLLLCRFYPLIRFVVLVTNFELLENELDSILFYLEVF